MKKLFAFAPAILLISAGSPALHAQITNSIHAHIGHSFIAGESTLPPGDYTFRIERNTDENVMKIQNSAGDNVAQVLVRQSTDKTMPKHSELIFKKYGNEEFLSKVYESGSKAGVAVSEISKQEKQLMQNGQHGSEHTEEQP